MLAATQLEGDETYFARLAELAPSTIKWIARHGVNVIQPTYYLAKGPPRIQPEGGGLGDRGRADAVPRSTPASRFVTAAAPSSSS